MTFDPTKVEQDAPKDLIEQLVEAGEQLGQYQANIKLLEDKTKDLKDKAKHLSEFILPELMNEAGLGELKFADGSRIVKVPFVHAKVSDADTAFAWLREKGEDAIIKNTTTVWFDRGEDEISEKLLEELKTLGLKYEYKQAIHPSTLKAFIKEALENENLKDDLPRAAFGVYEGEVVQFK